MTVSDSKIIQIIRTVVQQLTRFQLIARRTGCVTVHCACCIVNICFVKALNDRMMIKAVIYLLNQT